MNDQEIKIRIASEEDAPALLEIYAPYVKTTAITFEYEVPSCEEFANRIRHTLAQYPYLVAEKERRIIGYAYTGTFNSRPAYDWSVETSIYIAMDQHRLGVGRRLYEAIEEVSKKQEILNLNACIAYTDADDKHLSRNSVDFHVHLGFSKVGIFHQCGYKFDTWYDMVWMEKMLGPHQMSPSPFIPFQELVNPHRRCI
ncbi:MAG: GNAT family N-acetyltransferase [Sphaerochaetaceae bacterium]|jgi:L-amino acid N-acyltransferase YncA|nr:GNAT family N-acetyltransferase [Sphaerochaetaceae bacterium]MDD3163603.1 GNAT family N-acetyltransferase [Sphaerochaetaceae bacterium]MDD4007658.1 GNAT family N-acetyltransferase [Sphaerochaetaceae bacterium]MDD4396881.1 GNAT family N-acetyltransferase [Sphaerochaetaceae bacterium]